MKLCKIKIKEFGSIEELEIDFSENPRVLVGINESGKTNILHALRLLGNYNVQNDDIRETSTGGLIKEGEITFIFEFDEKELKEIFEKVRNKILMRNINKNVVRDDETQYNLKDLIEKKYKKGFYTIDLIKKTKSAGYYSIKHLILSDTFKKPKVGINYTFGDPSLGTLNLSNFEFIDIEDFKNIPANYFDETVEFKNLESLIEKAEIDIIKNNLPKVVYWEYKDEYLLPRSIPLDSFIANPNSCIPLKNLFLISDIPEDRVSSYLQEFRGDFNRLQSRLDKVAKKATNFFKKAWPEYKNIEFNLQLTETSIKCSVKELNKWDFQKRSDGFRRFIALLLHLFIPAEKGLLNNALILIDDAEISLHPHGCRYLLEQLKKLARNNYVMFATHSIFMIDTKNIKRHYIVKKKRETTTIKEATEENYISEEVLYNALGASVYEVLKNKNILFEGWTDKKLFEVFISNAKNKTYQRFFEDTGRGHCIGVKSIKNILPILEMGKRKCLIITDSDNVAKECQREWKENKGWGVWKRYDEISRREVISCEDFIKKDVLINKLKETLKKKNIDLNTKGFTLPSTGRLYFIKNKLKEKGLKEEKVTEIIKELKETIFNDLKYEEIEDDYAKVVEEIKKEIETL
ncbi:MAG: AAA family ATPase [Candidatus Pacearchaeota archaeon]